MIFLTYTSSSSVNALRIPNSEYARRAHPDRFANILTESVAWRAISSYPNSMVDVAVSIGYDYEKCVDIVTINGNATTLADIGRGALHTIVAEVARHIGYSKETGFNPDEFILHRNISPQSREIMPHANNGVAADSRPCYGYACAETELYLPKSTVTAKAISDRIDAQFDRDRSFLGPDGKTQVMVQYKNGRPKLQKVVIHAQHRGTVGGEEFKRYLIGLLEPLTEGAQTTMCVFVNGGPRADKGQSGTKSLIYGEAMPNGGGGFYGLDPTKPERYGSAVARQIAKSIVANGIAERCKVHVAYSMGEGNPSIFVESIPEIQQFDLERILRNIPLSSAEAIQEYNLRNPSVIASVIDHGFIGNNDMKWEGVVEL